MLIVPELQKVFILVPRTGSGTLYREMKRVYPRSMLLYRHMEADGCPRGYDRWERIGFVRHPLYRLWSLYHFLHDPHHANNANSKANGAKDAERKESQVAGRSFEEWLFYNDQPFTSAIDITGGGEVWPILTRSHAAPENKLSQFQYLRPDLGTTVLKFEHLQYYMREWGLDVTLKQNHRPKDAPPNSEEVWGHLRAFCKWDLEQGCCEY